MTKNNVELESITSLSIKSRIKKLNPQKETINRTVKRMLDILLSIVCLVLFAPVFTVVATMYLFGEAKGPIFYKQQRVGKDGELFALYKFRSMVVNAEEKLKSNEQLYQIYLQNNYKLEQENDPRITKLGQFLRKTSLDEIPQFLNILKGDMSLIGPRPVVAEELKEYDGQQRTDFLSVLPGITGYWQVNGRSTVGYPERVKMELYYVYHQSLLLDFKILLQTFHVVFSKKGAY